MRSLVLVALIWIAIPLPGAFAHGDHGDADELVHVYEVLTDVFTAYLQSQPDQPGVSSPADHIYIEMGGHRFPVNKSAMHQLLTIATMRYNVRHLHENPPLLKRILSAIQQFLLAIPTKVYRALRYPRLTLKNLSLSVEAYTHRLSQSYSPAIFVVIGVTQGAWEALESVIMPGGVHVACTVFNGMLLVAVVPLERMGEFSAFAGSGYTFPQRVGLTLKALFQQLRALSGPRRRQVLQQGDVSLSLGRSSLQIADPTALEETLQEWGFFDGIYQDRAATSAARFAPQRALADDLRFVLDAKNHPLERYYVAFAHSRGLAMLQEVLANTVSQSRHEGWLRRNEWLPLERITGRLHKIHSLYSTSLLMLAAGNQPSPTESVVPALHATLKGLISMHQDVATLLDRLHHAHEHLEHARAAGGEKTAAAERQWQHLQQEANHTILRLQEESKALKANLKAARSQGSYISWLKSLGHQALAPTLKRTRTALAPFLRPVCHFAFGGKPDSMTAQQ